jgi:hypothetical protein
MEKYNEHTPIPWVADLRGGCCAVYHKDREKDTNGLHSYDSRNIVYSNRDSHKVTDKEGIHWEMDIEAQENFAFIVESCNNYYRLKEQNEKLLSAINAISSELYDDDDKSRHLRSIIDQMKSTAFEAIKSCES